MDDLIDEFIAETREMIEALGGAVVAWEAEPGDRARLDEIFRFVHTVKGNSGFFDLPRIQALSHAAEDALSAVRSGGRSPDAPLVSAVLAILDRVGELVDALASGAEPSADDDSALIAALSSEAELPIGTADSAVASACAPVRTIRLPVDLLDRMMSGVSDLVLARNDVARRLRSGGCDPEAEAAFERLSSILADLRDSIARTRMQRLDRLFAVLPRLVRDLGEETGRQVELEVEGADVEIDREMIETIRDPLTHIVRNAIGHGLEAPADRLRLGKPEAGRLRVSARQSGNQILIEIADDGRGIDGDALVRRALAAGALTPAAAERLSPAEKQALVFEAGVSTASEITAVSGRGVGMDVVRSNIERVGGRIDLDSHPGAGTRVTLCVPLTLTVLPALGICAGGQAFAVPRAAIEEIVRVKGGQVRVESVGGASLATVRGRRIPLVCLAGLLGRAAAAEPVEQYLILLKPSAGGLFALAVDSLRDHEELVVKPAAPAVMATGLYAGTTIADDGRPVLLLDPAGLAARARLALEPRQERAPRPAETASPEPSGPDALLLRALDGRRRLLVPLASVLRIEDVAADAVCRSAGRLRVTAGKAILPLEGCGNEPPGASIRILRLLQGGTEIAYGFDEVIDILPIPAGMIPSAAPSEASGVVLVEGEQVELLDVGRLFARHAEGGKELPLCVGCADEAYVASILAPLVESAGYRLTRADAAAAPEEAVQPRPRRRKGAGRG